MPRARSRTYSKVVPILLLLLLVLPARSPWGQDALEMPGPSRIRVELIQVFVTVVDRAGNPITDLTVDDFVLLENGKPMEIEVFEPPERLRPRPAAAPPEPRAEAPPAPATPPPAAATGPAAPEEGRTYIVVFDGFNNPSGLRFKRAKEATIRFLDDGFQDRDRMAIFELRPQMRSLSDLTGDRDELRAAIGKAAFLPGSNTAGLLPHIDSAITDTAFRSGDLATQRLENLSRFNQMLQQSGQRDFYNNLTAIGEGMSRLPGRKYLLLFSGGFPLLQTTDQVHGYVDPMPAPFRQMLNQMARSNTAIYTMNIGDETYGADVERQGNLRLSMARVGIDENTLEYLGLDSIAFGEDPFYTKQSLAVLAGETGGRFVNDADYDKALASIDRELAAAYTLGYYPRNVQEDGRFRKIKVKVKDRSAYDIQHRAGYFAPKPYRVMGPAERQLALTDAAAGRVHREDLPVRSRVGFLPGDGGNTMTTVTLEVPLRDLDARPMDQAQEYALDVVMLARDFTGEVVDSIKKVVEATLGAQPPPDAGLRLVEGLTLPPGEAEVRFVVRDNERGSTTTRTERIQVPDFRYRDLSLTSLYLMDATSPYQLVDADFLAPATRQRLAREAQAREEGKTPPPPPESDNPFLLPDGSTFQPGSARAFQVGNDLLVYLQVLNLGWSEEIGSPLLSVTFDLKHEDGPVRLPSRQEALLVQGIQDGPCTVVYRLGLDGLDPGNYALRVTVLDKVANAAVQGSESIRIEAIQDEAASADAAGR